MACPSCGYANREGARFCAQCATPVIDTITCPSCGATHPPTARHCDACGQTLAEPAAPSAAPDPRTAFPEHLAEKIRAGRGALEGEHKQVTVLFADVMGSMELAERSDPEEWRRIMDRFFSILCAGVHRFEGTVDKFTGDGIMALFGAPIAPRAGWDDRTRAVDFPFLDFFGRKDDMVSDMTKREHRELVASFVMLDDVITRASHALSNGDIAVVERELEQAKRKVCTYAPALTVPEAAEELGVSRPTVRSWIAKGLLDVVADSSPQRVRFASVQQLKGRLGRLRALAKDERRFSQLLREAADQRALEQPGAREGLQDAVAGDTVDL